MESKACSILIVDDEDSIRSVLQAYFMQFNFLVSTASNSYEALKHLDLESFDLIISGINQPGMDGLEMAEIIYRIGGPPVIILTGHNLPENRLKAYKVGARAFLLKPVSLEWLMKVINMVLHRGLHFIGPLEPLKLDPLC